MKKLIIIIAFQIGIMHLLPAQTLTNNGGLLTVDGGSALVVKGDFRNLDDGSILNSGDIFISGHWINNATSGNLLQGTTGNVHFDGPGSQVIGGTTRTWFNGLHLQADVILDVETSVSSGLLLSGASMDVNGKCLIMQSGSSLLGAGASGYIIVEDTGRLIREVGNSDVLFPVGTHTSYVPLTVRNDGATDLYGVNVFGDVLDGGTSGATIPEIGDCVQITWDINEMVAGGSDLTVTPQWNSWDEGTSFDRMHCGIGNFVAGSWVPQPATAASGYDPYSVTRSGIVVPKAFAVGDTDSPLANQSGSGINLRAFLEGPFNGAAMNTTLNTGGYIPLAQPYNQPPWNYMGTEAVASIPNINVTDWILIELRDAPDAASANSATMISQQAAFLLNDGSVVNTDGSSILQFSNVTIQHSLFAVLWHRNHIGIMSAVPLTEAGGIYSYDFTTDAGQVHGSSLAHKQIATGIWGMAAGDGNADGQINNGDKNDVWAVQAGASGYMAGDFNMDSQVNNGDKNDLWVPNTGMGGQVPDDRSPKCYVPE